MLLNRAIECFYATKVLCSPAQYALNINTYAGNIEPWEHKDVASMAYNA